MLRLMIFATALAVLVAMILVIVDASLPQAVMADQPAAVAVGRQAGASSWPNWMGKRHDGISLEAGWSVDWPEKGSHALLLYSVETGEYRVLARMRAEEGDHGQDMHPHPSWSRDGNRVYFNGSDTGQRRLYAVDLEHFEF